MAKSELNQSLRQTRHFAAVTSTHGWHRRTVTKFMSLVVLIILAGCDSNRSDSVVDKSNEDDAEAAETTSGDQSAATLAPARIERDTELALPEIESTPLTPASESPTGRFADMDPQQTGLDLIHVWDPPRKHEVVSMINPIFGTGVAIGDIDNDGLQDVFVARQNDGGRLFRNLGEMKFADVTTEMGIDTEGFWGTGTTFVDINNDGLLDLYLCGHDCPNRLYINEGDRFTEQASRYKLDFHGASIVMNFCDYDLDGDLDAYLVTNHLPGDKPVGQARVIRTPGLPPKIEEEFQELVYLVDHPDGSRVKTRGGQFDHLFRNDDGVFTDVTEYVGIGLHPYLTLSASWWDYNNDGLPDLYVANDYKGPDFLYENLGPDEKGIVRFRDVIQQSVAYTPWYSMGSDFGDINNDGHLDYMTTDMAGTNHYRDKLSMGNMSGPDSMAWFLNWPDPPQYMRNALFLNSGAGPFLEIANMSGVAKTDWTWSTRIADFDDDGLQDVMFTNGMTRDLLNSDFKDEVQALRIENNMKTEGKRPESEVVLDYWKRKEPYRQQNLIFRNKGDLKFNDYSENWGFDHVGVSTGAATGDLDGDGDLDMIITGYEEPVRLYRNDISAGNVVRFKLVGRQSNRSGIGARVTITTEQGTSQTRFLAPTRGFMSTSEPLAHFGVGQAETVTNVRIQWPSGLVQQFENLPTNHVHTIAEPAGEATVNEKQNAETLFTRSDVLKPFAHRESEFDDFARQPLLPNKSSQLGPGMAWGDIDGDGDDDLYLSGAAGAAGQLIENRGAGQFELMPTRFVDQHISCEDMGALFFDADGDGDQDLYVVSGGVECEPGDDVLQDRLYLNDGQGEFSAADLLPDLKFSGSCVAAADFDRDGDLDLFVGGRVIPGAWPETPRSAVLENTGERFVDVTDSVSESIRKCGLVTAAVWSDVDNDEWPDLMVVAEWGPVHCFLNQQGRLVSQTADSGLGARVGWYNSISAGDIDNDGDTDFVVGNFGLNTKYKASTEVPTMLYYGDFEGTGEKRIVEAKFEDGVCLPRRGLSCSSHAMPSIRDRLPTFHDFATADLIGIYSSERLDESMKLEANSLESGVLINDSTSGQPEFRWVALPKVAQASPVFGSVFLDVDRDGFLDLYLVQNFFGPQRETGYMSGGISCLLRGDGSGAFQPVPTDISGLIVRGDAKSLVLADLNEDGQPDFVVGNNNAAPDVFINQGAFGEVRSTRIEDLAEGRPVVGAKVYVNLPDGSRRLHEVTAGSGYLSQSPGVLFEEIDSDQIVWPTTIDR